MKKLFRECRCLPCALSLPRAVSLVLYSSCFRYLQSPTLLCYSPVLPACPLPTACCSVVLSLLPLLVVICLIPQGASQGPICGAVSAVTRCSDGACQMTNDEEQPWCPSVPHTPSLSPSSHLKLGVFLAALCVETPVVHCVETPIVHRPHCCTLQGPLFGMW